MSQAMKPKPPAFLRKPRSLDSLTKTTKADEFARLGYFLGTGFTAFEGSTAIRYKVVLADGVSCEDLFAFLKTKVLEIPPSVIGFAGNETLRMFRMAETEGLVSLQVSHKSDVPLGVYK